MTQDYKLSLPAAILINVNIMLGAGIFINTVELAKRSGALCSLNYVLVGLLLLPLIIGIAELLRLHPGGSFYTFGQKEISPFAGFISAWSYFAGKLASAAVMIHTSVLLIQQLIPVLANLHPIAIDCGILSIFIALNMLNLKAGSTIQSFFIAFKTIPIFFAILVGLYLFQPTNLIATNFIWSGIPSSLPLVFYATMGFEAACSLSNQIKNPEKNASRAVIISYAIVLTIVILYQFMFYGALGTTLAQAADYRGAFPRLLNALAPTSPLVASKIASILHIFLASSALGGSYGIIFSNTWNLHALAEHNHIPFPKLFMKRNRNNIPFMCVLVEGILIAMYFFITQGYQFYLQQLGVLGVVFAYTISILALRAAIKKSSTPFTSWLPLLGLASCLLLLAAIIRNFYISGLYAFFAFVALLLLGVAMFLYTTKRTEASSGPFRT